MARPRTASDETIFAAAVLVMQTLPPSRFTLQAVAKAAGITAAALVQRFGSKHGLQVALARASAASTEGFIAALRARTDDPVAGLRFYADCMAGLASSPAAIVRNLAYLQEDIGDPELRAELRKQGLATRRVLQSLIEAGLSQRRFRRETDARTLARSMEVTVSGALLVWAIYQEGSARSFMRARVDEVLGPWLT